MICAHGSLHICCSCIHCNYNKWGPVALQYSCNLVQSSMLPQHEIVWITEKQRAKNFWWLIFALACCWPNKAVLTDRVKFKSTDAMALCRKRELGCPVISMEKVRFSYTVNCKYFPAYMMLTRLAMLIISLAPKYQKLLKLSAWIFTEIRTEWSLCCVMDKTAGQKSHCPHSVAIFMLEEREIWATQTVYV